MGSPYGAISTLMTSAPISAMSRVQDGPARYWVKSRTLMPCRYGVAWGGLVGLVGHHATTTCSRPGREMPVVRALNPSSAM